MNRVGENGAGRELPRKHMSERAQLRPVKADTDSHKITTGLSSSTEATCVLSAKLALAISQQESCFLEL